MRSPLLKLLVLCFGIILGSCSPFYTRHYTKGLFYDGLTHRRQPATLAEKPAPPAATPQSADSLTGLTHTSLPIEKARPPEKKQAAPASDQILASVHPKCIRPEAAFSSPLLKKALKPMNSRISAARHGDSIAGKAVLYILALVLAVGIVALAVYFLPSILLPAQVVTTFSTILLIGAIVLLCVFAFLIYTLTGLLIDLFKQRKTPEEDTF